jgi:hypothetical protein
MSESKPIQTAPKDRPIFGRSIIDGKPQDVVIRWDESRQDWVHADGGQEYPAWPPELWMEAPPNLLQDIRAFMAAKKED